MIGEDRTVFNKTEQRKEKQYLLTVKLTKGLILIATEELGPQILRLVLQRKHLVTIANHVFLLVCCTNWPLNDARSFCVSLERF